MAAHGYLRFTKDVDIVIRLIPDNIERTFAALASLGYRPSVPITKEQFADRELRNSWVRDKGMQVLQFWSDAHRETSVDVFVTEPFDFDTEYASALLSPLDDKLNVRFMSLPTLIRMKEEANRPQDRAISSNSVVGRTTMPTNESPQEDIDWRLTTWEGARCEQMRRWSKMPLAEIILALEEMQVIADQLSRSARAKPEKTR